MALGSRKIDGVRCLAICKENIILKGRGTTNLTKVFTEIVEKLKGLNCILDGEIVCDTFEHTQARVHTQNKLKSKLLKKEYPAKYYVFDILNINGKDLRDLPLIKRLQFLKELPVDLVENTFDLVNLWERAKKENWEGIIIKNPLSRYVMRRSYNWLKIKYIKSKDVIINSYEINPAGIRADGEIAVQISGKNAELVKKKIDETGKCKIEVHYLNETSSGKLRMATFKCIKC